MGTLPIPAALFFEDFADNVLEYKVLHNGNLIGTYRGLQNSDEGGTYIGFLMSDHPKIEAGYTICTSDDLEQFDVCQIAYDRYEGQPELLKAYY